MSKYPNFESLKELFNDAEEEEGFLAWRRAVDRLYKQLPKAITEIDDLILRMNQLEK